MTIEKMREDVIRKVNKMYETEFLIFSKKLQSERLGNKDGIIPRNRLALMHKNRHCKRMIGIKEYFKYRIFNARYNYYEKYKRLAVPHDVLPKRKIIPEYGLTCSERKVMTSKHNTDLAGEMCKWYRRELKHLEQKLKDGEQGWSPKILDHPETYTKESELREKRKKEEEEDEIYTFLVHD